MILTGPEEAVPFELCLLLLPALLATFPAKDEAELLIANGLVIGCIETVVDECSAAGFATAARSLGFLVEATDGACFLTVCVNTGLVLEGMLFASMVPPATVARIRI